MPAGGNTAKQRKSIRELRQIRELMIGMETAFASDLRAVHPVHRRGALNLLHYLALFNRSGHPPAGLKGFPGLLPLMWSETGVLAGIEAIIDILGRTGVHAVGIQEGTTLREKRTRVLLGPKPAGRRTRIMVTASAETAVDPAVALNLVKKGMDVLRINCARDDSSAWLAMIENLRRAERKAGRPCRVFMDLAGPKLRTGVIEIKASVPEAPPAFIRLRRGDRLLLTRSSAPGTPGVVDSNGRPAGRASVGVTSPRVLDDVRLGETVWIDDGKIGGVIRRVTKAGVELEVTSIRDKGRKLRADRGINFPGSRLRLPPVTDKDADDIRFISGHADMAGLSFVRDPRAVNEIRSLLAASGGAAVGLVVKVENRQALERLPALLLAAMRSRAVGVLIARGDLAVECGFEQIADLQEEILGLCKAAYVPVIWATQVLENLTRDGVATRAEMTDAVAARRAECVLLNKGPYIDEALEMLDGLLRGPRNLPAKAWRRTRSLAESHGSA
jgi:pyruvate kinase